MRTAPADPDEVVRHQPHVTRFEIEVGGRVVSWLEYAPVVSPAGTVWRIDRTVTAPELRGRALAGRLVAHVVDDAAAQGVRIDPRCPFVRHWLARHPERTRGVVESEAEG